MFKSDNYFQSMGPKRNYIFEWTEDGQFNVTKIYPPSPYRHHKDYIALDAEMVGVGPDGLESALARISMVNWECQVVFHTYVKPEQPVTDFRSFVSGIRPEQIEGESAMTLENVREVVSSILCGKILIGHGLQNDLKTIGIQHPPDDIRDSATFKPFMKPQQRFKGFTEFLGEPVLCPRKLKDLTLEKLGRHIQKLGKPHNPVEDAIASMELYKAFHHEWEFEIVKENRDTSLRLSGPQMDHHYTRMYSPLPLTTLPSQFPYHHQLQNFTCQSHDPSLEFLPSPLTSPLFPPQYDIKAWSFPSDYNCIDTSHLNSPNQGYTQNHPELQQHHHHVNIPSNYHSNDNNGYNITMNYLSERQPNITSPSHSTKDMTRSGHFIRGSSNKSRSSIIHNKKKNNQSLRVRQSRKQRHPEKNLT